MKSTKIELTDEQKNMLYNMALIQYKNIDRLKVNNGHNIFKLNIEDSTISNANTKVTGKKISLEYEVGNIYIAALNIESASKKFNKIIIEVDKMIIIDNAKKDASLSLKGDEQIISNNTENNP